MRLQEHVATNIDFQIFYIKQLKGTVAPEEGPLWKSQNFKIFASYWRIYLYMKIDSAPCLLVESATLLIVDATSLQHSEA